MGVGIIAANIRNHDANVLHKQEKKTQILKQEIKGLKNNQIKNVQKFHGDEMAHLEGADVKYIKTRLFVSLIGAMCFLGISCVAHASIFGWHLNKQHSDPNSDYHFRFPMPFLDDNIGIQEKGTISLTTEQKHQATVWGLSDVEELRYVQLMQNRSGTYFKNKPLSPVEILGINARTDAERVEYAELAVQQEFEKNAKILAFNAAYSKAALTLKNKLNLPIIRSFDYAKYSPYNYRPVQLKANDRLMLFVKKDDVVRPIIAYLMSQIEEQPSLQLNIYFIDNNIGKTNIEQWARSQNIPAMMVEKNEITLNFDHGQYAAVKEVSKQTPLLFLVRDGLSRIVDTGRF